MNRLKINKELKEDITNNYNEYPASYFCSKHNVPISTIYSIATKLKVTGIHQLNNNKEEILKKYNDGISVKKLTKEFNHGRKTIIKFLTDNGCNVRNKRDSHLRFSINENYFELIDSHEKSYWLGFIYADGNIYKNKLQIGLAHKDKNILNKFKRCINSNYKLYNDGGYPKFIVRNNKIVQDLNKLGVFPKKSLNLIFPDTKQVSDEFINSFILGYFDGDGWITYRNYKNKFGYKIKSWNFGIISTFEFCQSVKNILDSVVGRTGYIRKEKRSKENVWTLCYSGSCMGEKGKISPNNLYNFIYNNIKDSLNRKKKKFNKIIC